MGRNVSNKGRRIKGRFTRLPEVVLATRKYSRLSAYAVKLLVDIARQYNGLNNGDLQATYSLMKDQGWRSKGTLAAATRELQEAGFIEMTRQGGMNLGPSLWAVTWEAIDECRDARGRRKTDSPPTRIPTRLYLDEKQNCHSECGPDSSESRPAKRRTVRNADQTVRNADQ